MNYIKFREASGFLSLWLPLIALALLVGGASDALANSSQIAAGMFHSVALKNDGTVLAWGKNDFGQLGDGTNASSASPVQVSGLSGVTALSACAYHNVALKNDGTVWAWGNNDFGQLGDGTTTQRNIPVQVPGLNGVIAVAAGDVHTVAVKNDGTVWSWGWNGGLQLGDGTITDRKLPVQVVGLGGVIAVAAGREHSVALKDDGTVWAWGTDFFGQLGDGQNNPRATPVQVVGLSGVTDIAAGEVHSMALKDDGTVWAWGNNDFGQLGDVTTTNRNVPGQVPGLGGVTAVAAGAYYNVVRINDGTVLVWGADDSGQLGDGFTTTKVAAQQVAGIGDVAAVAAGFLHTMVLKSDGTVWAWGADDFGQLGDGAAGTGLARYTPVQSLINLGAQQFFASTPVGNSVAVTPPGSGTTVTFSGISSPGTTSVSTSGSGQPLPTGFQLGTPPIYYDISTSATYTPPITICINFNPLQFSNPSAAQLLHFEGGQWVNITISLDVPNHLVCGLSNSFSPFTVAQVSPITLTYRAGTNGSISGSTSQSVIPGASGTAVTAVPNPGYHFVSWSDGVETAVRTDLKVTADLDVTASFTINSYTLTVNLTGTGNGTVSSAPGGITCLKNSGGTVTCSDVFSGDLILSATPTVYSLFGSWSGTTCSGSGACSFTMTGDITISAEFKMLRIGSEYQTLQTVYDAAPDGTVIQLLQNSVVGTLTAGKSITVKLSGGYDPAYEVAPGMTD